MSFVLFCSYFGSYSSPTVGQGFLLTVTAVVSNGSGNDKHGDGSRVVGNQCGGW